METIKVVVFVFQKGRKTVHVPKGSTVAVALAKTDFGDLSEYQMQVNARTVKAGVEHVLNADTTVIFASSPKGA